MSEMTKLFSNERSDWENSEVEDGVRSIGDSKSLSTELSIFWGHIFFIKVNHRYPLSAPFSNHRKEGLFSVFLLKNPLFSVKPWFCLKTPFLGYDHSLLSYTAEKCSFFYQLQLKMGAILIKTPLFLKTLKKPLFPCERAPYSWKTMKNPLFSVFLGLYGLIGGVLVFKQYIIRQLISTSRKKGW